MKLTESKLRQIIKEEMEAVLEELKDKDPKKPAPKDPEGPEPDDPDDPNVKYGPERGWTIEVEWPDGTRRKSLQCITMTLARKRALQIRSKGYKVHLYYGCRDPI